VPLGDPIQTGADFDPEVWKETEATMPILADIADAVVGVDTHRDVHSLQIAHSNGVPIAEQTISNNDAGYAEAIDWAMRHAPGPPVFFAMEGSRSYGIGLSRALTAAGPPVVEVVRPARDNRRRGKGKTDQIDAGLAVLAAVRMDTGQLPTPRADGDREALRILLDAREEMTTTRTRQVNRLRALLLTGDDDERQLARGALTVTRLEAIGRRRIRRSDSVERQVLIGEIQRLARVIRQTDIELTTNARQLTELISRVAPKLLQRRGVGPVSAAQAIVSFSHPGRCRHDGAFASLAGTCPIPASSGKTTRWRLNRGGDRALNRAIHTIAHSRMVHCPRTRAYVCKRQAEGKSTAEIRRCIKRYVTRELFRALTSAMA
jgi:transposase